MYIYIYITLFCFDTERIWKCNLIRFTTWCYLSNTYPPPCLVHQGREAPAGCDFWSESYSLTWKVSKIIKGGGDLPPKFHFLKKYSGDVFFLFWSYSELSPSGKMKNLVFPIVFHCDLLVLDVGSRTAFGKWRFPGT